MADAPASWEGAGVQDSLQRTSRREIEDECPRAESGKRTAARAQGPGRLKNGESADGVRGAATSFGFAGAVRGGLGGAFELVAQSVVISAFEPADRALTFPRADEMFEAARALDSGFAAFRTALVAQHAQLILALTRNLEVSELVFDALVHVKWLSGSKKASGGKRSPLSFF